jgi:hypothetical protein
MKTQRTLWNQWKAKKGRVFEFEIRNPKFEIFLCVFVALW